MIDIKTLKETDKKNMEAVEKAQSEMAKRRLGADSNVRKAAESGGLDAKDNSIEEIGTVPQGKPTLPPNP